MIQRTYSYCGNAQPRMTNVIPIEPENARRTNLEYI